MAWLEGFNVIVLICTVCFSLFKLVFEWLSEDLEYVIVKGDQLYKEQNTLTLFSCVDLLGIIDIENVNITVTFLENVFLFFLLKIVNLSYLIKLLEQNNFLIYFYFLQKVSVLSWYLWILPCRFTWSRYWGESRCKWIRN